MKRALYLFALLVSSLMLLSNASAQLEVNIRTTQTQFLAGESIVVGITITNRTGNDIILASRGRTPWLDFVVKRGNGEAVSSIGRGDFAPVKIAAGQAMAKSIEVSRLFHLKEQGTYTISAVVRPTGDTANGFISNRILFTTANARADWSQCGRRVRRSGRGNRRGRTGGHQNASVPFRLNLSRRQRLGYDSADGRVEPLNR